MNPVRFETLSTHISNKAAGFLRPERAYDARERSLDLSLSEWPRRYASGTFATSFVNYEFLVSRN